jgi:solute carrier family 25 carnitine/acylcarnitine transporter 20/29
MVKNTNPIANFIAGGVGGSCAVITGHPFDTVKVRVQTAPLLKAGEVAQFNGVFDCFKQTVKREGFFALYKGMAAPLAGVSPLFAVYFLGCSVGTKMQQDANGSPLKFHQNLLAGGLAGFCTTAIMVPGERIKCVLQVQGIGAEQKYSGPMDVARKLYAEGGIRSIYRGTAATLLRDIPASGAYLATYEFLVNKLSKGDRSTLSPSITLFSGGMAGLANWGVCLPADVLKSRLQTAPEGKYPNGIRDVARELIRTEGVTALWKGFTPVMLRAFPANAACFMGFELALNGMGKIGF